MVGFSIKQSVSLGYDQMGVQKKTKKKTPEMNDSELDMICKKNLDKKYYFLTEKYFCKDVDFVIICGSTSLRIES